MSLEVSEVKVAICSYILEASRLSSSRVGGIPFECLETAKKKKFIFLITKKFMVRVSDAHQMQDIIRN